MAEAPTRQLIAQGDLGWMKNERQTDRYGAIYLQPRVEAAGSPDDAPREPQAAEFAQFEDAPVGSLGRLVARVTATRESHHVGDVLKGVGPSTPEVGETVVLGEGELFVEHDEEEPGFASVGVRPVDGRETAWMEPRALYRVHDQTVELYFEPESS